MRPTLTAELKARFARYFERNPAMGPMHIVLSDCNTDDSSAEFCVRYLDEMDPPPTAEERELTMLVRQMSRTQRERIYREKWHWLNDIRRGHEPCSGDCRIRGGI